MRGVAEVIWRVAGKRRRGCGLGIKFFSSSVCPSAAQTHGEEPPIVLWGRGGCSGCRNSRCCQPVVGCIPSVIHN